jgi:hypothetical protein
MKTYTYVFANESEELTYVFRNLVKTQVENIQSRLLSIDRNPL